MIDTEGVLTAIRSEKLVAILRGLPDDRLLGVAEALYAGGVRLIECTFDHTREDCVSANASFIATLASRTNMLVGAGTVLTVEEARAAVDAGASFIISPDADEEVIAETRNLGAVSIPGAYTPTEIACAWKKGAHFVKLFPAGQLGSAYIKAVRAPLKHIPMLAVGGVTPETIPEFKAAGICGFGVGGPLLPKQAVESGDYEAIRQRAQAFCDAVKEG